MLPATLLYNCLFRDCKLSLQASQTHRANTSFQWWTIDRIGRRKLFISNAIGMCVVLVCEAICVAINTSASSIAAVVFVFAFEACFTWGSYSNSSFSQN